jgi:2-polyprenyl-6-methoxyphenol hydroxylase-like FAD-dependent oxidoreductase
VTIYERAAEARPTGAGLLVQPAGLAVLSHLCLDEEIAAKGARIEGLHGETTKGTTLIDLHYKDLSPNLFGVGIHRGNLFDALYNKAMELGAKLVTDCDVVAAEMKDGKRALQDANGKDLGSFDLVVDASGYKSPLRKYGHETAFKPYPFGALWGICKDADNRFQGKMDQRYKGTGTMIGLLPVGKTPESNDNHVAFFWSMPADKFGAWKDGGLDKWKSEVLSHWPEVRPLVEQFTSADQLRFAPYAHAAMKEWHAENMAFIGDAAHSTSPQLGQGANMAFIDALTLAQKLEQKPTINEALAAYSAERKQHIRFHQKASRLLTPFFQSASKVRAPMRNAALAVMKKIPYFRGQMTRTFAGAKKGVFKTVNPGQWNKKYGI